VWRRVGGGILALVLAFLAWAWIAAAVDLGGSSLCSEATPTVASLGDGEDLECFDGSAGQRIAAVVLGAAAGLALALAALAALAFALTGRRGRLFTRLLIAAGVLVAIAILVLVL
jgi:hypothetical protein